MKNFYISKLAGKPLTKYLNNHGFTVKLIDKQGLSPVYDEISTHADIHMCQIGLWENSRIFPGNIKKLQKNYPGNILYNAVFTGKYFIHNLKHTAPELISYMQNSGSYHVIDVNQGYTRCTCLPVDDSSFITSDAGIIKKLNEAGADLLAIQPGYIKLAGFDYGFIGGCGGNLVINGRRTVIFNGDLSSHPDYKKIAAFIKDRDIDLVYFDDYPLEDIGSILTGDIVNVP